MICSHQLAAQSCVTQQFHRRSTDTLLHKELHDASGQQQQPQQQADGKAKEGLSQRHAQSISGGSRGGEASLLRHRPGSIEAAEAALVAHEESMQRPPQLLQQPNKRLHLRRWSVLLEESRRLHGRRCTCQLRGTELARLKQLRRN